MAKKKNEISQQDLLNAATLAQAILKQSNPQQAMVGIRNVSDMTIGLEGKFGSSDIQLFPDTQGQNPNTTASIPAAWWVELRKSKKVADGLIVRDDSVLSGSFSAGDPDRPEDLPKEAKYNAILDPKEWIDSRTETEIRADLDKITNIDSLRRIRRAVDDEINRTAAEMPDEFHDTDPTSTGYLPPKGYWDLRKKMAFENLKAIYRLVDDITTRKIEGTINKSYA